MSRRAIGMLATLLLCACARDGEKHTQALTAPDASREEVPGEQPGDDLGEPPAPGGDAANDGDGATTSGGFVAVAAGTTASCAARIDGTVACWGAGAVGGAPTETCAQATGCPARACTPSPTDVAGLSGVASIGLSGGHGCALRADHTVWCWGDDASGQLGDGTPHSRMTAAVVPGLTNVAEIAVGGAFTCARLLDGTVKCWGNDELGRLGVAPTNTCGTSATANCLQSPTTLPGVTNVAHIAAGSFSTCIALTDGSVKCVGALGGATTLTTIAGPTNVVELADAGFSACARQSDGVVWCWGGVEDTTPHVVALGGPAKLLAASLDDDLGQTLFCAELASGTVKCWGAAASLLGTNLGATPTTITSLNGASRLALTLEGNPGSDAAIFRACVLRPDGAVACLGGPNCVGEIGDGTHEACTCAGS